MTALAIIGLVVGLVVLLVVIKLLNGTLAPLRAILADLQSAKTAGMLEHGVRGAEQLSTTRSLASSVPDLALRYLNKLGSSSYRPAPAQPQTQSYTPAAPAPSYQGAPAADERVPEPPAWKNYS
ncbi:MAG: hypothetical protein QOI73_1526 [Solirubrobacteraceae bacterium]|jgi:uncharacterized membrane-anchored protein YhcB (DUF1043 family)|nr:hypothetical protein [Solirubrobacteraceae bacterium]